MQELDRVTGIKMFTSADTKSVEHDALRQLLIDAEALYQDDWCESRTNDKLEWLPAFHEKICEIHGLGVMSYTYQTENGDIRERGFYAYSDEPKMYIGEQALDQNETEFRDYSPFDWAMYFVENDGQYGSARHKAWVLDQVAQLHKGVQPVIKLAKFSNGYEEYRIVLGEKTQAYKDWVEKMETPESENEYWSEYDAGTAP